MTASIIRDVPMIRSGRLSRSDRTPPKKLLGAVTVAPIATTMPAIVRENPLSSVISVGSQKAVPMTTARRTNWMTPQSQTTG
ncbi:hypothetical protein JCM18899A_10460 [Nocardioides sp. AN3]